MIPGTRPVRRVARAAPFPARARRSALKVMISGMDVAPLRQGAGIIGRCKVYPDGSYPSRTAERSWLRDPDKRDTQLNRLETERSSLIRRLASPIRGAI